MKKWVRMVGVLIILGSSLCFWQFRKEMAEVALAKSEVDSASMAGGLSTDPRALREYESASAREAGHRTSARNWFLGGVGAILVGSGLVGASWLARGRAPSPVPGNNA